MNSSTRSIGRVTSERNEGTRTEKPAEEGFTVKPRRAKAALTSASATGVPSFAAT